MQVWMRIGDGGDYEAFDDLQDASECLAELMPEGKLSRCCQYGFTDGVEFTGQNYISLYWGDDDAEPVRDLTDKEIKDFNRTLGIFQAVQKRGR